MRNRLQLSSCLVAALLLLLFLPSSDGYPIPAAASPKKHDQNKGNVVYVCACLKTKSCACMTEAKMEGPCACGTEGGPPLQPVQSDSDWAKQNRDELAK